jgi:hypothetical protein
MRHCPGLSYTLGFPTATGSWQGTRCRSHGCLIQPSTLHIGYWVGFRRSRKLLTTTSSFLPSNQFVDTPQAICIPPHIEVAMIATRGLVLAAKFPLWLLYPRSRWQIRTHRRHYSMPTWPSIVRCLVIFLEFDGKPQVPVVLSLRYLLS